MCIVPSARHFVSLLLLFRPPESLSCRFQSGFSSGPNLNSTLELTGFDYLD
jgi:hypothetical protein